MAEMDLISTALSASLSEYSMPDSEVAVEMDFWLEETKTAFEELENLNLSFLEESESLVDASGILWEEEDIVSTSLSATASEYSIPDSEADVEMPICIGSTLIQDGIACISQLKHFTPIPAEIPFGMLNVFQDVSEYEMPKSEADVTMTEADLRI